MAISTAVDISAVARVVGIKASFKNLRGGNILFLPQRVAVIGQGSSLSVYPSAKRQVTSEAEVASIYGAGSPLHLAARQLFPVNGDGVGTIPVTIYPLVDAGTAVASSGDIAPFGTPTVAASYVVKVNNISSAPFVAAIGDSVAVMVASMTAAINAVLEMPVIATDGATKVDLKSKWSGTSANDLVFSVEGSLTAGTTFVISQAAGGLVNPDVDLALALVGGIWETLFINCMDVADTVTLDKFSTFGEGRYGALVRRPMVAFVGDTQATVAGAIAVPDSRKTDRINSQIPAPGSLELPLVVAARAVSRIARLANSNPPHDYGSQDASGLEPGPDGVQWNYLERDQAVKAGSSTIEVKDGVINLADTVTFFHPTGDPIPAYRFVVDIVKLQTIIFNLDLIFATDEWNGAPLIPDNQPTVNRSAKKPKTAVAAVAAMLDSLADNAIISNPVAAKDSIVAGIDSQNPKRLNLSVTVQLSGNTNIISIDLDFGFFFGTQALVA